MTASRRRSPRQYPPLVAGGEACRHTASRRSSPEGNIPPAHWQSGQNPQPKGMSGFRWSLGRNHQHPTAPKVVASVPAAQKPHAMVGPPPVRRHNANPCRIRSSHGDSSADNHPAVPGVRARARSYPPSPIVWRTPVHPIRYL